MALSTVPAPLPDRLHAIKQMCVHIEKAPKHLPVASRPEVTERKVAENWDFALSVSDFPRQISSCVATLHVKSAPARGIQVQEGLGTYSSWRLALRGTIPGPAPA